jgi:hypothetical protein
MKTARDQSTKGNANTQQHSGCVRKEKKKKPREAPKQAATQGYCYLQSRFPLGKSVI